METEDLDVGLDSRFMLPLSVGPDCHSGVLISFKTSVFVSKLARDDSQDAPRHTRFAHKLSCRYTDLYFRYGTIHGHSTSVQCVVWRYLNFLKL